MSEFRLTAGAMQMLLHYYTSPEPFRGRGNVRFDEECHNILNDCDLIFTASGGARWEIADKGRAYVEMVLETPLPVQKWARP